MPQKIKNLLVRFLKKNLPENILQELVAYHVSTKGMNMVHQIIGPYFNRKPIPDSMPFDLQREGYLQFEDLTGLFASTSLNHGIVSMTIRQCGYLFGLVRRMKAKKVIEIGRYKGGSTMLIAAAMQPNSPGHFWSVDIGKKETRLSDSIKHSRSFDEQITDICKRLDLQVEIIVGDSRTLELDTGEVDMVFIDGDHSYAGVKNDFERFGKKVRLGGAVLFDDAFDEELLPSHSDSVGLLIKEILAQNEFKLVKSVDRLAHLQRIV